MTEKLKNLMHAQADSVDFAVPDVETLVRAGDRRRRTRRLSVVGGFAAASVAAALVMPGLLGETTRRGAEPTGTTDGLDDAAPVSWVIGSVLHEGDTNTELPFQVRAYIRTAEGYVFSDRQGTVWSWVDNKALAIGRADPRDPQLVSDDETGFAGWLDPGEGYAWVDQQHQNGFVRYHQAPSGDSARFEAIDAGTAYWTEASGLVAFDLTAGRSTPLDMDGTVADIEDDLVAVRTDDGLSVRTLSSTEVRLLDGFYGELGSFSADARYVTNDADEPQVYDVAAGERVELDVAGRRFATGYEWLGAGTLAVIAAVHDGAVAELLVCQVPSGDCEPVAELGTFDEIADSLVLPVGEATDG